MQVVVGCISVLSAVLCALGVRISFFRLDGAFRHPEDDSMPLRFQRAHGNLAEWLGAFAAVMLINSSLVVGQRAPGAFLVDPLAIAGTAGLLAHKVGMICVGLRRSNLLKMLGMTAFYTSLAFLSARPLLAEWGV